MGSQGYPLTFSADRGLVEQNLRNLGMTEGEIQVAKKLVANRWLRDNHVITIQGKRIVNLWGQYIVDYTGKRLDLLLLLKDQIIIIEVKNRTIEDLNINEFDVKYNPWWQLRGYIESLREKVGKYISVIGIVVLPSVHEKNATAIIQESRDKYYLDTWTVEDLSGQLPKLLDRACEVGMKEGITVEEVSMSCAIHALFPDNFVKGGECKYQLPFYVLEAQQSTYAFSIAYSGHRVLYGVAGSGKTVLLVKKARQLALMVNSHNLKKWHILVLCYNKPLQIYLKNMLAEHSRKIEVLTFHGWLYKLGLQWDLVHDIKDHPKFFEKLERRVNDCLSTKKITKYRAILIDEGQDFEKAWFKMIYKVFQPDKFCLFAVYLDSLQAVHKRKTGAFRWVEVGLQVSGGRTKYLRENYRNRSEIGEFAKKYAEDIEVPEDSDAKKILTESFVRHGGDVEVLELETLSDLVKTIGMGVQGKNPEYSVMIVLDRKSHLAQQLSHVLGSPFIDCVNSRNEIIPSNEQYPIFTVQRSKGLEADIVFFIYSSRIIPSEHYVAITRAREEFYSIYFTG